MAVTIIEDIKKVLPKPQEAFDQILLDQNFKLEKKHILFAIFMNTYYILVPSYFVALNILVILMFFILIGVMYYFSQECMIIYKENREIGDETSDDLFFYRIAYCFALANIPALLYSVISNTLSLLFTKYLIVGMFIALLLTFPGLIFSFLYPLKLMRIITRRKHNLKTLIELAMQSFIRTCNELLGYRAVREVWEDLKVN